MWVLVKRVKTTILEHAPLSTLYQNQKKYFIIEKPITIPVKNKQTRTLQNHKDDSEANQYTSTYYFMHLLGLS